MFFVKAVTSGDRDEQHPAGRADSMSSVLIICDSGRVTQRRTAANDVNLIRSLDASSTEIVVLHFNKDIITPLISPIIILPPSGEVSWLRGSQLSFGIH